ncbi:hypothetical protein SAMN04490185_2528 [Pseudomonas frederiksbergensis]|jgi:hypothetical protein|uniref:Uncharacterized protein n=1 Tax=Pseudomonas frederiksbergensis TaxID=104087 RepID=A0A1H4X2I2_9PSED|nr:hypothetical protein SAMN04490185_2528 [Pseudomonas frederiksbergensis]
MTLNKYWRPGFGELITWFAMDKNGAVAVMVNNCFVGKKGIYLFVWLVDEEVSSPEIGLHLFQD